MSMSIVPYRLALDQNSGAQDAGIADDAAWQEQMSEEGEGEGADTAPAVLLASWKKPYSTRGVRAMLARYAAKAGLPHNMPPRRLRHFLFTWLKSQSIDDGLIQPYSGHASRTSLEVYSKITLGPAQEIYDGVIDQFPV